MLLIVGTVQLPPQGLAKARPAMHKMIASSRDEPGCLHYSYAEDVLEPGLIHVTEIWSSQAALDAHFSSAHLAEWRATWPELGIGDRNLTRYVTDEGEAS